MGGTLDVKDEKCIQSSARKMWRGITWKM